MENYYYKQKCKKCCSLQSISIIYNYIFNKNIDEYDLMNKYPWWKKIIEEKNGKIGIDNVARIVSDLFKKDVYINKNCNGLIEDIERGSFIIVYYNKHYSPILDYNGKEILIGKNITHDMVWVDLKNFLKKSCESYISFLMTNKFICDR